jgi:hypothetical protein
MSYKIETYQPITTEEKSKYTTDKRLIYGTGVCYRDNVRHENVYEDYQRKTTEKEISEIKIKNKKAFEGWINGYKKQGYHIDRIDKLSGLFTNNGGLELYPVTVFFKKQNKGSFRKKRQQHKK